MRRSPSGSGVLGDRGALWAKRHPRGLHQYLQIRGLDPDGHEEELTCSPPGPPLSLGATLTLGAPTPPPLSPLAPPLLRLEMIFAELQLQPALLSPMVGGGRKVCLPGINVTGAMSVYLMSQCWLTQKGGPSIPLPTDVGVETTEPRVFP